MKDHRFSMGDVERMRKARNRYGGGGGGEMKFAIVGTVIWGALSTAALFVAFSCCGSGIDPSDLARIRSVTCPSVCAAYADAVDAGVGVSPEDVALMEVCECGHE